jgi:PEGA domain
MGRFVRWVSVGLAVAVAGCSVLGGNENKQTAPEQQYAVNIQVLPYIDARNTSNARKVGTGAENLSGLSGLDGTDIVLDKDVATLVNEAMSKGMRNAGFKVTGKDAMFVLSGTIKELTYNVKAQDEISISVESTLKDAATGKVLWAGIVDEKKKHFPGVTGGSMGDVVEDLDKELGIVSKKTGDAISAVLMAQHPELFNILPGTKVIPGVTVLNAPGAASAVAPAMPAAAMPATSAPVPAKGKLVIGTVPQQAKVYVDDVYYGMSPLHLDMEPGIHSVAIELEGYRKVKQKVSVRKGDTTDLELKLKKR